MATTLQTFRFTARSCKCRPSPHQYATKSIGIRRPFSTTPAQRNEEETDDTAAIQAALDKAAKGPNAQYGTFLQSEVSNLDKRLSRFEQSATNSLKNKIRPPQFPFQKRKEQTAKTFLNDGEDEAIDGFPDYNEEDDEDIPTLGHGELEHHREMRHYARLAAWEMPMLSTLAKPFVPPTADMPLRFRYTTYMGEQHPAEKKVGLEFCTEDIRDLTPVQREKLKKLAGVRYNPETDIIKMSCEMFESQAQNKRYLGDLVDNLVREAKDPTDTFEDIPLDTRHHVFKTKPKFPKEWLMTEARQAALEEHRQKTAAIDEQRMLAGQLVDGVKRIEDAFSKPELVAETLPGIDAHRAGKGKGRTVAVRR